MEVVDRLSPEDLDRTLRVYDWLGLDEESHADMSTGRRAGLESDDLWLRKPSTGSQHFVEVEAVDVGQFDDSSSRATAP